MSLSDIISNLFAAAQNSDPKEYTLGQGLRLRASWDGGLRRLLLIRPSVTPSEKEVEVCVRDAGIKWFTTTPGSGKSGCWVLITELPSSPHQEQWIAEIVGEKTKRDPWWGHNPDPWISGLRKLSDADLEVEHIRNVRWHQPCKKCGRQPKPDPFHVSHTSLFTESES